MIISDISMIVLSSSPTGIVRQGQFSRESIKLKTGLRQSDNARIPEDLIKPRFILNEFNLTL